MAIVDPARRPALAAFVAEYEAERFFEAHEVLEDAWLDAEGDEKLFLQALIQLAAAAHKGRRLRHARGMASLYGHALEKLAGLRDRHGDELDGLDLARIIAETREAKERAEAGALEAKVPRLRAAGD